MTTNFLGGATVPLDMQAGDAADFRKDSLKLAHHALIDRLEIDLDSAMVHLGEAARAFHGLSDGEERIGLRRFVDCYDPSCRSDMVCLFEKLAGGRRPFHFIADMAAPVGAFVHGFVAPTDEAAAPGGTWSGLLVMARQDSRRLGDPVEAC